MRLRAAVVALVLLVAAVTVGAAAPSAREAADTVLGIQWGEEGGTLVRLDAGTLETVGGQRLPLRRHTFGWSFSADRSRLVLGNQDGELLLVDTATFRRVAQYRGVLTLPALTAWFGERLVVVSTPFAGVRVEALEPRTGRRLAKVDLPGSLAGVERLSRGLVLLLGPSGRIGSARLVTVDDELGVRQVALTRIRAGSKPPDHSLPKPIPHESPGLAVDDPGQRVFVAGGDGTIAEIDLRTLAVAYHRPAAVTSADSLTKGAPTGPIREARWLGGGMLAVWGRDDHAAVNARGEAVWWATPAGAKVVDTTTWSARTIDGSATSAEVGGDVLLTWSAVWQPGRKRWVGRGLRGFGGAGRPLFHVFGATPLGVTVAGDRALVEDARPWATGASARGYGVVDVATGELVRQAEGLPPFVLSGSSGRWLP